MELKPGLMIAHYRLIEKIGAGGMGIVWSALDTRLDREVAIKILPPQLTADNERRLRFEREAKTAAGLSHPNIAVIHEVGEHEGTPYLVMELLKGKTLRDTVNKRALPAKEWLEYGLPVAGALAHAHKAGIVHRDLKSSNVMVTEDGHVKLLDFGLAKLLDPKSDEMDEDLDTRLETISRELTQAGKVLGTVAYMSPEQARGEAVDHRSDIFSFGVLLYELASGRFPFKGNTDIESLSATLSYDPPSLSDVAIDAPPEAERIVTKALEKEPGRRYQTADDMVSDFRNLKRDLDTGRVTIPGATATGVTARAAASTGSAPTAAVPGTEAPPAKRFKPWMIGVAAVVVVAAAFGVFQLRRSEVDRDSGDRSAVSTTSGGREAADTPAGTTAATEATRIVVLPFENLGSADDEFFAAGVTEEIIGRLASVGDLAVISRSSAFQYDKAGKTMQQIGQDFGVDYILDGTVRWASSGGANRVRISPQLVRVADDTGVWGETYDSPIDDIFQVQTDIAGKVIEALGVVLLAGERESLEATPTESQDAYRAYLRGVDALTKTPTTELAQQMFERAVELDPTFHQAWAGLSRAHSWRYHGGDRVSGRCEAARDAADEALRLAPNAPEARMALGLYYYRCFRDYKRALAEIEVAGRDRPNDTDVISWKATLNKRQGNLREAERLNRRVLELDPMDFTAASELAVALWYMREYREAVAAYDRAIAISPDVPGPYSQKARIFFLWKGTTEDARATLNAMPTTDIPLGDIVRFWLEYYDGRFEAALAILDRFPEIQEDQTTLNIRAAQAASCYDAMGDVERARISREAAVEILQAKVAENPEDFRPYSDLGPLLAALGRRDEALAAAKRAVELMPPTKDAEAAVVPAENLALTYALLGDYDEAFDLVEECLQATPGLLTVPMMRMDPRWKKLTEHPRFDEIARRYDTLH